MKETIEVPVSWLRELLYFTRPCSVLKEGKHCPGCVVEQRVVFERISDILRGNKVEVDD